MPKWVKSVRNFLFFIRPFSISHTSCVWSMLWILFVTTAFLSIRFQFIFACRIFFILCFVRFCCWIWLNIGLCCSSTRSLPSSDFAPNHSIACSKTIFLSFIFFIFVVVVFVFLSLFIQRHDVVSGIHCSCLLGTF